MISFHSCPVAKLGEKDTGGMNVYVLQLAMKLGAIGHQVDVYTRTHDTSDPKVINLGVGARVVHLDAGNVHEKKQALLEHTMEFVSNITAYREQYDLKYDLIHACSQVARPSLASTPGMDVSPAVISYKFREKIGKDESYGPKSTGPSYAYEWGIVL